MPGLRSRALISVRLRDGEEGERSLTVLRPVPQPSSVMVIGEVEERRVKAWVRRGGSRKSSMLWRMLPSVS
jgi:hypothetical protein